MTRGGKEVALGRGGKRRVPVNLNEIESGISVSVTAKFLAANYLFSVVTPALFGQFRLRFCGLLRL